MHKKLDLKLSVPCCYPHLPVVFFSDSFHLLQTHNVELDFIFVNVIITSIGAATFISIDEHLEVFE